MANFAENDFLRDHQIYSTTFFTTKNPAKGGKFPKGHSLWDRPVMRLQLVSARVARFF
jgi:hypothetical protein